MSIFRSASVALNDIIADKSIDNVSVVSHAISLQKLYIKYVKMMPSTSTDEFILGPRAFFIYLTNTSKTPYTSENLEARIREMVRNSSIMDTRPTETMKGKHNHALKIFASL